MNISASNAREFFPSPADRLQWYAAYTWARHEKCVAEHLRQREIESFLPLYETVRRWNNGRHRVQLPLFPGYVFVRLALRDKLRLLQAPGVVELVSVGGRPAPLPDAEMETLRTALTAGISAQPYSYLSVGSRIEICRGPLQGLRGILLRHQGQFRVVLSVEMIMRSIVVEIDAADVGALNHCELETCSGSGVGIRPATVCG
ncbi:MAG TPA: UpxY family transcription antiterminator [Candidatus Sulfotelmatobacter sp.]|nr:UpxY family transcription antiterminator [Candidatus Sulfotelmatobacter sp.]